jgi:hypothetical protein
MGIKFLFQDVVIQVVRLDFNLCLTRLSTP